MNQQPKSVPAFASEAEERAFWESHDSAEYVNWDDADVVVLPNLRPATAEDRDEGGGAGAAMAAESIAAN